MALILLHAAPSSVTVLFLAILAKVQYTIVILQLTKVKGVCSFVVVV